MQVPAFQNIQEEAEWFDANRKTLMDLVTKYGKWVGPRQVERTQQLTLRVSVTDVERARVIAKEKGIGYQTVLKQAIREGLKKAG
jgi:predicted DNA binding CopG/RHH family protein